GSVAYVHRDPGPFGSLEEAGEVEDLGAGTANRLGWDGEGVVGVLVAGHDGLGLLDDVDHRAEVAGRLGRVVGWDDWPLAVDDQDAVTVHHHDVQDAVAVDIANLEILWCRGSGQGQRLLTEAVELSLRIDLTRQKYHPGRTKVSGLVVADVRDD